ncbi:23S rRNA (guanosine(2251)-2'-O)-methyltransferase RlmB [Thermoproteota archaeon]
MTIIKGKHAVAEALASGAQLDRILVAYTIKDRADIRSVITKAQFQSVKVQYCSASELKRLIPDGSHQGIAGYMRLQKAVSLDMLIADQGHYPFIIAVDHMQDPYNFGAILRTCESFGIKAVLYPKDRNVQITPGVIKVSSGAVNYLDLVKVTNLASALEKLKSAGYWIYGADSHNGQSLDQFQPQFPLVLVMGSEQKGISKRIQKMVDLNIHIPIKGRTESLNVSVAAGIIMYQLSRLSL